MLTPTPNPAVDRTPWIAHKVLIDHFAGDEPALTKVRFLDNGEPAFVQCMLPDPEAKHGEDWQVVWARQNGTPEPATNKLIESARLALQARKWPRKLRITL